jgi:hypothetical protein
MELIISNPGPLVKPQHHFAFATPKDNNIYLQQIDIAILGHPITGNFSPQK